MHSNNHYFTETEPLIYSRLRKTTRILWVVASLVLLMSLVRCFSIYVNEGVGSSRFLHQVLSSASFLPYVLAMLYAEIATKTKPRLGTQITLVSTYCMLVCQVVINGDQGTHAMLALPVLMILAGFFTNSRVTIITTLAIVGLVATVTLTEVLGVGVFNPDSHGYFSIRSFIYILIVLFAAYGLIQIVVQDFFVIQGNLIAQKQQAEYIANHDTLTNLYNRYYTEKTAEQFFAITKPDEKGYVLFLDIDNFKMINTRFGHKGGDSVLKIIAQRIQQMTENKAAVACRLGGDEFIVLLRCPEGGAQLFAQKILETVSEPFKLCDETTQLTCSVGISNASKNIAFSDLYRQADTAMHRAKYTGKNVQVEHDQVYTDQELEHANILSRLKYALQRNEFRLHYQPQVDLSTGTAIGMEALIRWRTEGKELLPGVFIELAEQYGMINAMTEWVIRKACQDCKKLHDIGYDHLFVAVNISAVYLARKNLVQTVTDSLVETGLPASALELELTESVLFQQNGASGYEQLQQVRQLGVELSIDDFGTGYSNLQYLGQLDVQTLKIDKSFVMQLADASNKSQDLIFAIIDIANRFQLRTIAEGIETSEVAATIQGMKCDVGQGYYWSRPVSYDALLVLLKGALGGEKAAEHGIWRGVCRVDTA